MKLPRRTILELAGAAISAQALPRFANAQAYPARPVTMIVPFPAGGSTDVLGRLLAERMRGPLGQPVIVDNIGGADGSIGTGRAARANADGYTIVLGFLGTHVMNGALYSLPYDVWNDFAPISPVVGTPVIFCGRKTIPAKDLNELIAWLMANPNTGSAGMYTVGMHLLSLLFQRETGTRLALLPYRGEAPATQDLVAGQIDVLWTSPIQFSLVRAGSIRAYAATSARRLQQAPDIPTFAEMGLPSLSYSSWFGLFAPKGTSRDIVGTLNAAARAALADATVRSRLVDLAFEIFPREQQTPEALGMLQKSGIEKWWPIIKAAGIKAE
jgi:tripartite-type tricarboxylate transporter receptor subunit TctC